MRKKMMVGMVALAAVLSAEAAHALKASKYIFGLTSAQGLPAGTVTFTQKNGGAVKMKIELKNMSFGPHAVHIHQNAVCEAPDFKSAGPHFNPDGKQHGFQNPMGHHNGDTPGNVDVGEDHTGSATFTLDAISLDAAAANSIFANGGTSVVVHEHGDDMKTDPSGASGNRVACGVVKQ